MKPYIYMPTTLRDTLDQYKRIGITGGPNTGKTTLANEYAEHRSGSVVVHGDSLMHLEWSESSKQLAEIGNATEPPVIIEGVQIPRAIRKGLSLDVLVVRFTPFVTLTNRQQGMQKSIDTVLKDCEAEGLLIHTKVIDL